MVIGVQFTRNASDDANAADTTYWKRRTLAGGGGAGECQAG